MSARKNKRGWGAGIYVRRVTAVIARKYNDFSEKRKNNASRNEGFLNKGVAVL